MSSDKIKISVIVPPVVVHNLDPHTGIPFLPHMAAYLASSKINVAMFYMSAKIAKIIKKSQSNLSAFFRMKLRTVYRVTSDSSRKLMAIISGH